MAGAETLKAIHSVGNKVGDDMNGIHGAVKAVEDRVRDVEGMIQGVGDMLQHVDNRVKGIGDFATIGEQNLKLFIPSSVDAYIITCQKKKKARQMADYFDTMAPESLKTADEAFNKPEVVDSKIQGIGDTTERVSDRARIVEDSAQEIVIDGVQIFRTMTSSTRLLTISYV